MNTFKQIEVTRAVKGALAAGVVIREIIANKDGIRIISQAAGRLDNLSIRENEWDEVLGNGEEE
ncbi:hypothetical protein JJB09_24625 [Rhizobium sp. KVB221]|uniref:Uncharacterized protein n=1 Tax=Rhizobium setariae TaxID=2801340 RepID=A0A936YR43_9HYPH|nr:hypothetical protein [Rhizobium setariae]MBL0375205.1 hypothetical protein [Rhizobium setariae]